MIDTIQIQLLLATFAARANRRQAGLIAYLTEENHDQRRRRAAKGKPLGRRALEQIATSWGYARIPGALRHLDHRAARSTIAKVLKEHGIRPSPDRPMSWATFVRSHARPARKGRST